MSTYPPNGVIPELVSDVNLKRARTEINGKDAIRVVTTGTGTFSIDPQDFANSMGLVPAQTADDSVKARLDTLVNLSSTTKDEVTNIKNTQGSVSDAAWNGTGDATVISLLKGIAAKFE